MTRLFLFFIITPVLILSAQGDRYSQFGDKENYYQNQKNEKEHLLWKNNNSKTLYYFKQKGECFNSYLMTWVKQVSSQTVSKEAKKNVF